MIDPEGVHLHALRYTVGSHSIRNGVNAKIGQKLMGHADVPGIGTGLPNHVQNPLSQKRPRAK